jgi:hypothetical protein
MYIAIYLLFPNYHKRGFVTQSAISLTVSEGDLQKPWETKSTISPFCFVCLAILGDIALCTCRTFLQACLFLFENAAMFSLP